MIEKIDQTYLDGLLHAQKDGLIFALCDQIKKQALDYETLEAELGKPKKTSKNSSLPPSTGFKANIKQDEGDAGEEKSREEAAAKKSRKKRKGVSRKLHPDPDETRDFRAESCDHFTV